MNGSEPAIFLGYTSVLAFWFRVWFPFCLVLRGLLFASCVGFALRPAFRFAFGFGVPCRFRPWFRFWFGVCFCSLLFTFRFHFAFFLFLALGFLLAVAFRSSVVAALCFDFLLLVLGFRLRCVYGFRPYGLATPVWGRSNRGNFSLSTLRPIGGVLGFWCLRFPWFPWLLQ